MEAFELQNTFEAFAGGGAAALCVLALVLPSGPELLEFQGRVLAGVYGDWGVGIDRLDVVEGHHGGGGLGVAIGGAEPHRHFPVAE